MYSPLDPDSRRIPDYTNTTIRLVNEMLRKTGQPPQIVTSNSFRKLMTHLNPAASIPTVHDLHVYSDSKPYPHTETRCIVCGQHRKDEETVVLDVDTTAMILMTLIISEYQTLTEAKMWMEAESVRACAHHLPTCCLALMEFLNMEDTDDFRDSPVPKLAESCMYYKTLKMTRSGNIGKDIMIPEFQELVSDFLDQHHDPDAPVEAPLIKTEVQDSAESSPPSASEERHSESPGPSTSSDPSPSSDPSSSFDPSSIIPVVDASLADEPIRKILTMIKRPIEQKAVNPVAAKRKAKERITEDSTVETKETVLSLVAAIKADTKKREEKLKEEEEEREKYHQEQLNEILQKVKNEEEPEEDME